jgi:hypothetical protein
MSDYADIDMEFRNYRDRIADLEARIAALKAALREIIDTNTDWQMRTVARAVLDKDTEK